jgi:phosphoglycerol transferase
LFFTSIAGRLLPYIAAAIVSVVILVLIWHLDRIDWRVPLGVVSDHNVAQATVTNLVRDGHFYVNPLLGAPNQQELYDFPVLYWIHAMLLWVLGLYSHNPGLVINLFFFLSYPLVAVAAVFAFRRLGISSGLAAAGGVLYSFLPFHQWRNEGHLLFSSYYLVPLLGLVLVWVSIGHELFRFQKQNGTNWHWKITADGIFSLIVCILVGWDNPYCAFFGVMLLIVAALLGWLRHKTGAAVLASVILATVIIGSFGIEMMPSYMYIKSHGRTGVAERFPREAEIYGLTLVQMLAPVTNHRVPALARWKDRFLSQAILVNENDSATLGLFGAIGCIALFLCLLWAKCPDVLYSLSILNLSAFLLGTIGGLGAVFSFVVSPQLRGFNRISVFISFFCTAGALFLLDSILSRQLRSSRMVLGGFVFPAILVVIGVYDQVPRGLMPGRDLVEKQYREDAAFVGQIESMVPPSTMIFQLPYVPFPESPPVNKMSDYEELKGYLHSSSLRWSYGAMRGRADDMWLAAVSREPLDLMLLTIAKAGFGGVYIDRYGYSDNAAALESELAEFLGTRPIVSEEGRLSFFPLDGAAVAHLKHVAPSTRQGSIESALSPLLAEPSQGCWPKEGTDAENWYWCGRQAKIEILNSSKLERDLTLEATFATGQPTDSTLTIKGLGVSQTLKVNSSGTHWIATLKVPPGEQGITLSSDAKQVLAREDPRNMFFRINNFHSREADR